MKFFILSLVVWRVTYMLTEEDGPYNVFTKLRDRTETAKWLDLSCFYCTSVLIVIIGYMAGLVGFYEALGLSTTAIFINLIHERLC